MKEILFHGKRIDNGDWVEGYYIELPYGSLGATIFSNDDELVCEDTKSYIIRVFTKQHTNYSNSNPLQVIECEKYEVIPETVGQFTGLTDKNGKKFFEGDIVKFSHPAFNKSQIGVISYEMNETGFVLRYKGDYSWIAYTNEFYEVIGNIYDNPELLEVEND